MKKFAVVSVLVLLCFAMIFSFAFADRNENGDKKDKAPEGVTVPEETVTLDFWFQDWAGGQKWLKDWEKVFEQKYPTIDVNLMFVPFEELQSKLIPSVSQGTEPTLMYCYVDWLTGLDTSKLFARLSPEIFTKGEWAERIYDPVLKSVYSSDGEIYVIPWVIGGSGWGIVYHNDLLEEAGIDPETLDTWDDIMSAAKKLQFRRLYKEERYPFEYGRDIHYLPRPGTVPGCGRQTLQPGYGGVGFYDS